MCLQMERGTIKEENTTDIKTTKEKINAELYKSKIFLIFITYTLTYLS